MDRHQFKKIQYGQNICINFIFNFYEGLGSDFVFVLSFPSFFTHLSVLRITPRFPREGLPLLGEFCGFSWNRGVKTGGLWATSPPDAGPAWAAPGQHLGPENHQTWRATWKKTRAWPGELKKGGLN